MAGRRRRRQTDAQLALVELPLIGLGMVRVRVANARRFIEAGAPKLAEAELRQAEQAVQEAQTFIGNWAGYPYRRTG